MSHEPKPTARKDIGELMYVRCAGCGEWLDVKPGNMNMISHGFCQKCFDEQIALIDRTTRETATGS